MLIITKGELNTLTVTLTEKVTISNPFYLFVLNGKSNQAPVKKVLTDISNYTYRYNQFQFTEGSDITIPNAGQYTYVFYQKSTNSTTIEDTDVILETGLVRVYKATPNVITSHTTIPDSKVYEN